MRRNGKIILILLVALLMLAMLTGCLTVSAEDLFSLPIISEEYQRLQEHINTILSQGAEFSPPTGGPNRHAVQFIDLNGSGTDEVVAFFSDPTESVLRIVIFERLDGDYTIAETIEGVGTEIESIRFVDMDGDGSLELVVGWQMGPALRYMSIYSISGFYKQHLVSGIEYSELAVFDLNRNGTDDVILFRLPTLESGAVAEIYSMMPDGEIVDDEARLSAGIESISQIRTGVLADGTFAIFVDSEGTFENGSLVTDVLTMQDGNFTNVSLNSISGISEDTVRHRMLSSDITGDDTYKIPHLRVLRTQSETVYYAIDWYSYTNYGNRMRMLTTYHNNFDEWFLVLPFDWRETVSVRREDDTPGERTIIFSYYPDNGSEMHEDFLAITRLSGGDVMERATRGNRELLLTEGNVAYSFELLASPDSFGLTFNETMVRENFRLIHSEWLPSIPFSQ